ncbi:MAG: formylglycine-generating enzyme family protein, partial [Planctomycetes bacterium]|nr:formylglycine-generating enzyme family protein [Planctomycetota bacterium]
GEVLSCVGCHEQQNTTPPNRRTLAAARPPSEITPWYGPTRGFSFKREVQPVLDHYCVGCHDGQKAAPDLSPRDEVHPKAKSEGYNKGTKFSPSYMALRSFVRTATIESDIHLLTPCEVHADTTRLVQLLKKGHYGVALDAEAWDRLITWIDLHAPYHGTWHEIVGEAKVNKQRDRRRAMDKLYAGLDEDPEAILDFGFRILDSGAARKPEPTVPEARPKADIFARQPSIQNPMAEVRGQRPEVRNGAPAPQSKIQNPKSKIVELGHGITLELLCLPAGEFVMGDPNGHADEQPLTAVKVDEFWIGRFEVTNEQFALFDPTHDSRLENGDFLQFSVQERGYPVNGPRQPVCRVSWQQAMAFCRWLSAKTGMTFTLPTEAQWEYACRAGTATPMSYGPVEADFAKLANLADATLRQVDTFGWSLPSGAVPPWRPAIESVNDGFKVSAPVGSFASNPWGLHDLHGNVSEWTRSTYKPYPYRDDGRNDASETAPKVIRGGSWYDRPHYARSAHRMSYPAWQPVYDVGFRVVCESPPKALIAAGAPQPQ